MLSIRSQIIVGVISSIMLTASIIVVFYKLMWVNGHATLLLTISSIVSSCLTLLICSLFITPLVNKIKQFNEKTKQFANGNYAFDSHTFDSPKEIKELNDSFNKMAQEIHNQMSQITTEQTEKAEMVQNLAHDLKTPLAGILSYSEGLRDGIIEGPEDQKRAFEVLIKQANQLSDLFDDLTHVISVDGDKTYPIEMIQIDQLLVSILQGYEQRLKREQRTLDVKFCESTKPFNQSRQPLERILTNFLDNAIKFSEPGTRIAISMEQTEDDEVSISVTDEGCGISPELQRRIFERTFRVEDSRNKKTGGSGLGLFIAEQLAQQIHGTINVESTPGVGTTMTLIIPKLESEDTEDSNPAMDDTILIG